MQNTKKSRSVLLTSGGLDSTTLAYWLCKKNIKFFPVFVNYGQHCAKTELETLRDVLPKRCSRLIKVVDISDVYMHSKSHLIREPDIWKDEVSYRELYLPYRNLLILTVGAAFAQSMDCKQLYAAFINSNHAIEIDCSVEFFGRLDSLLSSYGSIKLILPFRTKSKYDVAKIGISLQAPIGRTFSCQVSSVVPCGACPNCVDRLEALRQL